jgi:hypothetical protein
LTTLRIVNVATRRVSDAALTSRYEDDLSVGLVVCESSPGNGQLHFKAREDYASSNAIGFAYAYKTIQARRLVRTWTTVTAGDVSDVVRDRAQRTLGSGRQLPCLQVMVASFTEPVTGTEPQAWTIEEWTRANLGRKRNAPPPGAERRSVSLRR